MCKTAVMAANDVCLILAVHTLFHLVLQHPSSSIINSEQVYYEIFFCLKYLFPFFLPVVVYTFFIEIMGMKNGNGAVHT